MTAASENEVPNTMKTETEAPLKTEAEPTEKTESTMKTETEPTINTEAEKTETKVETTDKGTKLEAVSTEGVEVESREFLF